MGLYRHNGKLIFFVHIPKTGGSSVREALLGAGAAEAMFGGGRIFNSLCAPQHIQAEIYLPIIPRGFCDFTFTVVRNPFSRLVSEYRWSTKRQSHRPSFDYWVSRRLGMARSNPYLNGNHLRPQAEFLSPGLEIFRFEAGLEAPIRAAHEALGLGAPASIPYEKRGTNSPVAASESTLRLIRERYAQDFEALGYDPIDLPKSITAKPDEPLLRYKNIARGVWYRGLRSFGAASRSS